jgi:hypothetical protein
MGKVIFVNFEAKAYYQTWKNIDKHLILLHSEHFDGAIMTQEAYNFVRQNMAKSDLSTHLGTPIDALSASYLCDIPITLENLKAASERKKEKP